MLPGVLVEEEQNELFPRRYGDCLPVSEGVEGVVVQAGVHLHS